MESIFAWTGPGSNYPEYVSINREGGTVFVNVRGAPDVRNQRAGYTVQVKVPAEAWDRLTAASPSPTPAPAAPDEHGETPETYEEIGRTFMDEYREAVEHPACADYFCCDGPSEIISHLLNKIEEAAAPARTVTREEIDALASQSGWRPIETAPKDGTVLIGLRWVDVNEPPSQCALIVWHASDIAHHFAGWRNAERRECSAHPTHWMPLPPAPEKCHGI